MTDCNGHRWPVLVSEGLVLLPTCCSCHNCQGNSIRLVCRASQDHLEDSCHLECLLKLELYRCCMLTGLHAGKIALAFNKFTAVQGLLQQNERVGHLSKLLVQAFSLHMTRNSPVISSPTTQEGPSHDSTCKHKEGRCDMIVDRLCCRAQSHWTVWS